MYFIETRQLGLEQESAKYGNATKKGRTSKQDPLQHLNIKRLGALHKFLKIQASEISPLFLRELIAITCL